MRKYMLFASSLVCAALSAGHAAAAADDGAAAAAGSDAGAASSAALASGEATFKTRCIVCHGGGFSGAPAISVLEAKEPEFIVEALTTGKMVLMSAGLSPEEKANVAMFLTRNRGAASAAPAATPGSSPEATGAAITYRRLTESQYRHAIDDTFGPGIDFSSRFDAELREEGLQAIGNAKLSITAAGMERYLKAARDIADQVLAKDKRDAQVGCSPAAPGAGDPACAEQFLARRGLQLFRRPLAPEEIAAFRAIWEHGATTTGDFHAGLNLALVGMLISPSFLFRVEDTGEDAAGAHLLDGYSRASRISFMLWDAPPDAELLEAARSGALQTQAGLEAQVDRLLASPRLEDGIRAFFTDMLRFEAFEGVSKDPAIYPNFSQAVADSAREETLRFLVDHLVARDGDYREIFTSRDTQINRLLAQVYGVAYPSSQPWTRYTFPEESERSGILTQVTFLSLFAHAGSSSPTVRGVMMNDIFQCMPTPPPPPDVDFSKVEAMEGGTVRTRLVAHRTNPGCSICHTASDPPGLALELFDGVGQYRTLENGVPIDVSATIGDRSFVGSVGLGQYMHDNPVVPACLVKRVTSYGTARAYQPGDAEEIEARTAQFAASGYRLRSLLRDVVTDPDFYRVTAL
jgi:mono/diheme cytochrome c family protein